MPKPNLLVPVELKWGIDSISHYSKPHSSKQYRCHRNDATNLLDNYNFTISTHTCECAQGYAGNPYLPQGCQDINECVDPKLNRCTDSRCKNTDGGYHCISTSLGALVLVSGGWWSYKVVKKRKGMKQRQRFFQRNGGLLLQQLSTREANVENTKLFNSKELEMATNHFNVNRIVGQGGQGTVYKGMLGDGKIVAIKKYKLMNEARLQDFINEVGILSQINHRNVVKLLGCCLETEVPMLVYEFIPNGTLSQYLNGQNEEFLLTWDMRLRIAIEVAGALYYLHSAASSPIYHRDIKSMNILLDGKYVAKVADFGIARSVAIDQTHLSTTVHGTFGYIDPEYFRLGQFTEKSDVYSFGVVLAELLTGEKAISSTRTPETKSLASYFITSMEENILFDILDNQVLKEAKKEEIIVVANLVKRCLNWNGRNRPTTKEVAMELEAIQMQRKASNLEQNYEEVEFVRSESYNIQCDAPASTSKMTCTFSAPVLEVEARREQGESSLHKLSEIGDFEMSLLMGRTSGPFFALSSWKGLLGDCEQVSLWTCLVISTNHVVEKCLFGDSEQATLLALLGDLMWYPKAQVLLSRDSMADDTRLKDLHEGFTSFKKSTESHIKNTESQFNSIGVELLAIRRQMESMMQQFTSLATYLQQAKTN
ncbi:wall-associated receptor kinase-like 10 [Juglans microcarpa x Juglans regia]|uniref:wall-associated receptor kinase-like 10 n=1 Tax=Juglans microcarpa x Juglans regia TaxID=2249226 RepID=UPI001B7F02A5|nr:wall-associated receptor kinase-like 10 [Juglans microcarpa x Juglans regia]